MNNKYLKALLVFWGDAQYLNINYADYKYEESERADNRLSDDIFK